jgi:predicted  nucleic acid-binding Zn-ribbon protein
MNTAAKLYKLQELEIEMAAKEQALAGIASRLGDDTAVAAARASRDREQEKLQQLEHRQRDIEAEIEDIDAKQAAAGESLYSGRIKNPKELSNLQKEIDSFKARSGQLEDRDLDIMEQIEQVSAGVARASDELAKLEEQWRLEQRQLTQDKEELEAGLAGLKERRQELLPGIEAAAVTFYRQLAGQKGQAVARVAQGICRGCGISLSAAWLQRARGGEMVRCTSCGRIIFLGH